MWDYLAANWNWMIPTSLIVIDKAVTVSKSEKDDLILTTFKFILGIAQKEKAKKVV